MNFINIAQNAKTASLEIADVSTKIKNQALLEIAQAIENNAESIYSANKKDLEDIPEDARKQLNFVWLETVDDALKAALATERRIGKNRK